MKNSWFEDLANRAMLMKPYPDERFPPSPYYRFLRLLAQNVQPKLSVELGVCGGGGSLHLAMGWSKGKVIGVDITEDHKENTDWMREHFKNFTLWIGDSIWEAENIYGKFGEIDILFVDTVHTYQRTLDEFITYKQYLSKKAVVCFDDLFRPEMTGVWKELQQYGDSIRLDDLHTGAENGGGFGVIFNVK